MYTLLRSGRMKVTRITVCENDLFTLFKRRPSRSPRRVHARQPLPCRHRWYTLRSHGASPISTYVPLHHLPVDNNRPVRGRGNMRISMRMTIISEKSLAATDDDESLFDAWPRNSDVVSHDEASMVLVTRSDKRAGEHEIFGRSRYGSSGLVCTGVYRAGDTRRGTWTTSGHGGAGATGRSSRSF